MRKARDLLNAAGATAPEGWEDALLLIAQEYPEAWDEDFAHVSEKRRPRRLGAGEFDVGEYEM
jgi:hypothetical protein